MIRKQSSKKKELDPMVLRRWLILATIALVVALTVFNIMLIKDVKKETSMTQSTEGKSTGEALIGGDFDAVDHEGNPFKFSDTNGTLRFAFFGFTNCPDVCPTALATLSAVQDELGADAAKVTPIFITVDSKRDTPEVIKNYISSFHESVIGVTGNKQQIDAATKAFKAYYSIGETMADGGYMVDHSGFIYLMSTDGKYLKHFAYDAPIEKILTGVKEHL